MFSLFIYDLENAGDGGGFSNWWVWNTNPGAFKGTDRNVRKFKGIVRTISMLTRLLNYFGINS